jgi:hypothetical protein
MRRKNWDFSEAPVQSGSTDDDTSRLAAAALAYLGLDWPLPVAPPAGAVPIGTGTAAQAASGEPSGLEDETALPDAAAVTAYSGVVVGVSPAPVDLTGGARPTNHAGVPGNFGLRNEPSLPGLSLRPGQLQSRLELPDGDTSPTAIGAAIPGTLPIEDTTAPNHDLTTAVAEAVQADGAVAFSPSIVVDVEAINPAEGPVAPRRGMPAQASAPPTAEPRGTSQLGDQQLSANSADVPVVQQTILGTEAEAVGSRRGMPTFARTIFQVPPAETAGSTAGPLGTTPLDGQERAADPAAGTQMQGQSPGVETLLASQAGLRVQPSEAATAGARDASRLEAQRHIADAFVSARQSVQTALTEAALPFDAQARLTPTGAADRPIMDRRWTGGLQEDIAGSMAEAVRVVGMDAGHSGLPGQSTGKDESNGRAFERRPPADLPSFYTTATRGAAADLAPERPTSIDAARAMAGPAMAEPAANGAPLTNALVQSLKLQWRQGGGEARLRLQPEYLGELTVSLRVQGSTVTAVLQCDSPSVRTWIETHQAELRRALEEQGLSLDTLTVDPEGHPQHQQDQSPQRDHQPRNWRRGEPGQFEALL